MTFRSCSALASALALTACTAAPTIVDRDAGSGFALYRSGRLDREAMRALCAAGVEEVVALNGDAQDQECRLRRTLCPRMRVRYNREQDARTPVSAGFLEAFDAWVAEARAEGRKIALHCRRGWHRAGRLTAWYRMRFAHRTPAAAIDEMLAAGRFMGRHRELVPQVEAMADHLAGRPCTTAPEHCVREGGSADEAFEADICAP